jgi:hypothetical protein
MSNFWEPPGSLTPDWQTWFVVPQDAPPSTGEGRLAAVWRGNGADHLDLFVSGADGSVMSNYWEPISPFWRSWFAVPYGPAPSAPGGSVTAVWRGGGNQHLDLFVVNDRGDVESNYWEHP